jgi:hypothetical protein
MILEYDVRKKLIKLLTGDIDLNDFETWLVRNSWNMHKDSSKDSQILVAAIELSLAELSSAHISEEVLRARFDVLVNQIHSGARDLPRFAANSSQLQVSPQFSVPAQV